MNEFDDLKNLWQQSIPPVGPVDTQVLRRANATAQQQLERTQLRGAILLLLTAVYLIYLGFFSRIPFQAVTTYAAIVLIIVCCIGQAGINLYLLRRLRSINVSAPVAEHLHQWETYYAFRKRLIRINLPVYYLLLNGAFALYFIEILGLLPMITRLVVLAAYIAWMLFVWFVLGKRSLRREETRLNGLISNLRGQQAQLNSD
jgi:hypothetical protein